MGKTSKIMAASLVACSQLVASAAIAEGPIFDASGRFAVGATDRVTGADAFLFGDATLHLTFQGLPLGLEAGIFGLADSLDTPHETYAALTWDFSQGGRLSLGVTRPAYDSFAVSELETQFPSLGIARTAVTRSEATFGAMFANYLPYGLRFENEAAGLRYAASIHSVPNQDTTIAGFGLDYPIGDWSLEGAIEVSWGRSTEVAGKIQARGTVGPVNGGVGLYLPGTTAAPDSLEVFASINPLNKVTLAGVIQAPLDGSVDPSGGISASYALRPDAAVTLGVLTDAGADASFSAHLDWRF